MIDNKPDKRKERKVLQSLKCYFALFDPLCAFAIQFGTTGGEVHA
jgi:hypothetical protein